MSTFTSDNPLQPAAVPTALPRRIGLVGGSAIMVGIIVGSGIFRTPASIAAQLDSPALILALWALGGLISLLGALTYSELATMFPESGGIYVFLREGLGSAVAFTYGWTYMLITKPLAAAGIAVIFAEHVNALLGTHWDPRWVTCALMTILTIVNVCGTRVGAGVAVALTTLKIVALVGIVAAGLVMTPVAPEAAAIERLPLLRALGPALALILWTYDGWSDVAAIAGEVRDPQKSLPRIFLGGTLVVTALYVAVNAVYLRVVPLDQMAELEALAPFLMNRALGAAGGVAVIVIVLVSTLGSAHGSIITGARYTFAQARDGLLFRPLAHVHPRFATPDVSLWFQLILSCLAAWFIAQFDRLAGGFVFTMWIFYGLAAVALVVLRIKRPDQRRPYRCWGFPWAPLGFLLSALAMTVLAIIANPLETGRWLLVLAGGVPAYYGWNWVKRRRRMG